MAANQPSSLTTHWTGSSRWTHQTGSGWPLSADCFAIACRAMGITYIKTHEDWSYLAVVIDLFSRRIVAWSMQSRMTTDFALQALLSAVWRRTPKTKVMIHSPSHALLRNTCRAMNQGSQFTSKEWQSFLGKHNLSESMIRRGNCHDNGCRRVTME